MAISKNVKNENIIPIFYAIDKNYLPFFAVTLKSVIDHCSKQNRYKMHVLNNGIQDSDIEKIKKYERENIEIEFTDVSDAFKGLRSNLHLRDYYTCATYYRIFIANMFPEYDKAVYLDSDTVVLDDIAKLYAFDIGDNLIGATTDQFVQTIDVFSYYTKHALGISGDRYFNAGVIIMNLKKFREEDFFGQFCALLKKYSFKVAQDQDYLNVICKDRVAYFDPAWNVMPGAGAQTSTPKLIHYNLTSKPWHYDNVPYKEIFWEYAEKSEYYGAITDIYKSFTPEMAERDKKCEAGLISLCEQEAASKTNYYNLYVKK